MKHKKVLIIILILMFTIFAVYRWRTNSINSIHEHINITDVESVEIEGSAIKGDVRIATENEMKDIVNWFNSISDIRKNKDFRGTTSESHIIILLKSKNKISVSRSGWNFEVQRYDKSGKWISYWGKQPDIERILEEAARKY
ncbi:MAG: hypothetical protein ABRQ25_07195 [Clostridiaceae bacterium]